MRKFFHTATDDEIRSGYTTDVYFKRTKNVLKTKRKENVRVVAEVTAGRIPDGRSWGILCGMEEVARLFEGRPVNVYAMSEGSLFYPYDTRGVREPVILIEGAYYDFCELETPLLGFVCHESGVATRAAAIRIAAGEKPAVAFGARRAHPALTPALDRAAFIGGLDGVSTLRGAAEIGEAPMGTMPHALIIVMGDQVEAWKAYDEVLSPEIPRVMLVDTYWDEKVEAVKAAEVLGNKLEAVRLDTPRTRRGDFAGIIKEVRWELNLRGYKDVGIFVSGGLDAGSVKQLGEAGADGFGVGTWVSCAPAVDFAMDIVEVEGVPSAKRGKLGGRKQVWRCYDCMKDIVQLWEKPAPDCPWCSGRTEAQLLALVKGGEIVGNLMKPRKIREKVLEQITKLDNTKTSI